MRRRLKDVRKIDGEADLSAEARTRNISSSKYAKAEAQSLANGILAANHRLKLRFPQAPAFIVGGEDFGSERKRGVKSCSSERPPGKTCPRVVWVPSAPVLVLPANRYPKFPVILVFGDSDFCAIRLSQ